MRALVLVAVLVAARPVHADCQLVVDTDDHAYDSATCFDKAGDVAAALHAYDFVLARFPRSKRGAHATMRSGELHAQLAHFAEAAARFEDYADRFAGEKDAVDGLAIAIRYRAALGDRERWIRDARVLVRTYGLKQPRLAAETMFDLTRAFDGDRAATIKHLREYLRQLGEVGGDERIVLANVQLGELAWRQACPVASSDGLCARRVPAAKGSCDRTPTVLAIPRDRRLAADAVASFEEAIRVVEAKPALRKAPEVLAAYGRAKLALVDRDLEAMLQAPFPKLSFTTQGASLRSSRRFQTWLGERQRVGGQVTQRYEAILTIKEPHSALAAAARIAQLVQAFASSISAGSLPHRLGAGEFGKEKVDAYCTAMREVIEPLEARAREAYAVCATKATELGIVDDWARLCLRELEAADPADFPAFRERIATPRGFDVPLATADGPPLPPRPSQPL